MILGTVAVAVAVAAAAAAAADAAAGDDDVAARHTMNWSGSKNSKQMELHH